MASNEKAITATLPFLRATKTTLRFDAPDDQLDKAPVTSLYVKKRAFTKGKDPKAVKIVITPIY